MKKAMPFLIAGAITGTVMAALSFFIPDASQAKSTLCAGLIAAITIMAIPIYDIDSWSLSRRSLAHCLLMLVTVLPLTLWSGWFSTPVSVVVFALFGVVGWTIGYLVNRAQEKKRQGEGNAASLAE